MILTLQIPILHFLLLLDLSLGISTPISTSSGSGSSSSSISSGRGRSSIPSSNRYSAYKRYRRDPATPSSPIQNQNHWLYPPTPFSPSSSSSYNNGGLAYRSILPAAPTRYTGLYRNRNLFSSQPDYGYNYNALDKDVEDKAALAPTKSTGAPSTTLTIDKSAPATESQGRDVWSTLPIGERDGMTMTEKEQKGQGHGQGKKNSNSSDLGQPQREGKERKISSSSSGDNGETSIVFPGAGGRGPKRGPAGTKEKDKPKSGTDNPDDYVPPPIKNLDKAAMESLRLLVESSRRRAQIGTRGKHGNSTGGKIPAGTVGPTTPLDIKGKPKCATESSGYCEEIDSYPKDFFDQILKNSLTLTPEVFQEVFGDSPDVGGRVSNFDVAGRDGLNIMSMDQPLCTSIEHTIYPKVAENKDGKFMYIVNHDEYIQGVRVEKCMKEGSSCLFLEGSLSGYQSTCKQKYIYRKLLAFTRDGKATTDTFRLPACCVCHVRSIFVDDRINKNTFDQHAAEDPPAIVSRDETEFPDNSTAIQFQYEEATTPEPAGTTLFPELVEQAPTNNSSGTEDAIGFRMF